MLEVRLMFRLFDQVLRWLFFAIKGGVCVHSVECAGLDEDGVMYFLMMMMSFFGLDCVWQNL